VAKLRAYHHAAQNAPAGDPKKALMRYGLDLLNGEVRDNVAAGVLEPTVSKVKSLKSAFEAAVSLLRIDDAIHCIPGPSPSSTPRFLRSRWTFRVEGRTGRARALISCKCRRTAREIRFLHVMGT
jgi:hypothetical protein